MWQNIIVKKKEDISHDEARWMYVMAKCNSVMYNVL